jgi:hypothetical protein
MALPSDFSLPPALPPVLHTTVLSSIRHLAGLADEDLDTPDPATVALTIKHPPLIPDAPLKPSPLHCSPL